MAKQLLMTTSAKVPAESRPGTDRQSLSSMVTIADFVVGQVQCELAAPGRNTERQWP